MLKTESLARRVLRSPLLHPLNDVEAIDDLLSQVNPLWSLARVRARIVDVRTETPDVKTFVLRPNGRWPGFLAGQHVTVEVEVDGVRRHRTFSLSSAPQPRGTVELTIKRQPHGTVTGWLHGRAHAGDVLTLTRPSGAFVLPERLPARLLMLSAGSGITPVMSMLRDLHHRGYEGRIAFVHVCRTAQDAIFGADLRELARRMPNLALHFHFDSFSGTFTPERLSERVPDHLDRDTYLCGPEGFMKLFRDHWNAAGAAGALHFERFGGPIRLAAAGEPVEVRAARSGHTFAADGARPLLADAEAAGLSPKYGCRIGICQTCKCRKTRGTVENLLTGQVSSEPGEMIQLCISAARSDVTLEL